MAQTPPSFQPSTDLQLAVTVGDVTVTPGLYIPIEIIRGKFSPILYYQPAVSPGLDFNHAHGCSSQSHVVVMLDLDTPMGEANRTYAPYLHWLTPIPSGVASLAVNDTTTSGFSVAPYVAPNPPAGSDPHRYVLMLFSHPDKEFSMPIGFQGKSFDSLMSRINFDLDGFIESGNFELVAANWFTTKPAQ